MEQEVTKTAKPSITEKKESPQSDFLIIAIFKKMLGFNYLKSGIKKKF